MGMGELVCEGDSEMDSRWVRGLQVGWTALQLGLTSFGGPVAHIGYFRQAYVVRKRWLTDEEFGDLTALCQFLPGPASSQLGIAIGIQRAGMFGGLLAWLGFTLPSALLLIAFAIFMQNGEGIADYGWMQGLKLAAVAVVAQAVWSMSKSLTPDRPRIAIAAFAAGFVLLVPGVWGQIIPIIVCAIVGLSLFRSQAMDIPAVSIPKSKWIPSVLLLGLFVILLSVLPIWAVVNANPLVTLADIGYRAGALVFGGGHVVLPMLHDSIVGSGLVTEEQFMAGYGATQAVPGPLFTFASYLGAVSATGTEGILRAFILLISIFLPSFLLVGGVMPLWSSLRSNRSARAMLSGVNAAVVGILLAALYDPVWTSAVHDKQDFVVALIGFLLLVIWRCPPWLLVSLSAIGGWILLS
jgi:chromate transporter